MKEKFTKGEWEFDRTIDRVVDASGDTICATGDSWNSYKNSDANAALIAAAPEMYEMLESIAASMECFHGVDTDSIFNLLAKARGEQ